MFQNFFKVINMLKKISLVLFFVLLNLNLLKANNIVNIGLTDETFEAELSVYINDYYVLDSGSDYYLDLSFFNSEKSGESPIFNYGIKVASPFSNDMGMSVAFGIRVITTEHANDIYTAVPFALFLRNEINDQINISSRVLYSPTVFNFLEAEGYRELRVQGNYALVDNNVYVFGGYRYIQTKYEDFTHTPSKGIYFGAQMIY